MSDITINVVICDRTYTITIVREQEEHMRKAVNDIQDKVKKFSQLYAYKDKQDLLAMTALQLSTENIETKGKMDTQLKITENKINTFSELIDTYLDK